MTAPDPELTTEGARSALRVRRRYDHPVERVWRAVTTPANLEAWFPSPVEFDLREGGEIRFTAFEGAEATGTVTVVDEPHRFGFTWAEDRFSFELAPDGDGTLFTLTQTFDDRAGAASFAAGWTACLGILADVLDEREPRSPGRMIDEHERLVGVFGLDEPTVTRDGDHWLARFERQLTCPAATAWDLFFGGEEPPSVGEEFRPYAAPTVVLGTVTELDALNSFAFTTAPGEPGDEVRLHFGAGTGHGARLILEVSGTAAAELGPAIDQWGRGAVEEIARRGAELALKG